MPQAGHMTRCTVTEMYFRDTIKMMPIPFHPTHPSKIWQDGKHVSKGLAVADKEAVAYSNNIIHSRINITNILLLAATAPRHQPRSATQPCAMAAAQDRSSFRPPGPAAALLPASWLLLQSELSMMAAFRARLLFLGGVECVGHRAAGRAGVGNRHLALAAPAPLRQGAAGGLQLEANLRRGRGCERWGASATCVGHCTNHAATAQNKANPADFVPPSALLHLLHPLHNTAATVSVPAARCHPPLALTGMPGGVMVVLLKVLAPL